MGLAISADPSQATAPLTDVDNNTTNAANFQGALQPTQIADADTAGTNQPAPQSTLQGLQAMNALPNNATILPPNGVPSSLTMQQLQDLAKAQNTTQANGTPPAQAPAPAPSAPEAAIDSATKKAGEQLAKASANRVADNAYMTALERKKNLMESILQLVVSIPEKVNVG